MANLRAWVGATLGCVAALGCGDDGKSCTVRTNDDGSATIVCDDGSEATVPAGTDGTSCTVREQSDGTKVIECDDGTSVTVTDGTDGSAGPGGDDAQLGAAGLTLEVQEVGVDADRHPYAVVRFTSANGTGLDRAGTRTQGAISANFTVAYLPVEERIDGPVVLPYVNYITREVASSTDESQTATQPVAESSGTWTAVDAADGIYRYAFEVALPEDYPEDKTHTIGIYATRTVDGVRYVANASPSFRPDGEEIVDTRDVVTNEACNTCHTPLAIHGGAREDVKLCATCHAAGYADPETGNTIDFQTMIHKIHRGASLPSVADGDEPYQIVGFRNSVHDYSGVHFPMDLRNCEVCHQGPDGDRWKTEPARASCGSCHDQVWFEEGAPPEDWMALHEGGDRPDDGRCTVCHEPEGDALSPITERHFTKFQEPTALDVDFALNDVTLEASRRLLIDFTVTVDGVGRDLVSDPLPRFSFTVAGPTTDYAFSASYSPGGSVIAVDANAGRFTYLLPDTVDAIAAEGGVEPVGTWAVGVEGYAANDAGTRYSGPNDIAYVALTDATAVPRRTVTEIGRCNGCHEILEFHGGARNDPMYCAMCHNGNLDTRGRGPAAPTGETLLTETVSFAHLIHRIHTGESGARDYTVYGFGGPVTFDELRYPADRRMCETCHVDEASYDLPLADAAIPIRTRVIDDAKDVLEEVFTPPTTAACTGCHDSLATEAHAMTMTTAMGAEACATCHAAGSAFGVDTSHARPEYDLR